MPPRLTLKSDILTRSDFQNEIWDTRRWPRHSARLHGNRGCRIHFEGPYLIDAPDGMRKTMGHCSRGSATKDCQSRAGPGADAGSIIADGSISLNRLARLYDCEVAAK